MLIQLPRYPILTSETTFVNGEIPSMVDTRLKPRRVRSRLAAGRVFGGYLQDQCAESPIKNRWACVEIEHESATRSGDLRTRSPV
jgi:hypothetical protein